MNGWGGRRTWLSSGRRGKIFWMNWRGNGRDPSRLKPCAARRSSTNELTGTLVASTPCAKCDHIPTSRNSDCACPFVIVFLPSTGEGALGYALATDTDWTHRPCPKLRRLSAKYLLTPHGHRHFTERNSEAQIMITVQVDSNTQTTQGPWFPVLQSNSYLSIAFKLPIGSPAKIYIPPHR